jgi:hypothetical protein
VVADPLLPMAALGRIFRRIAALPIAAEAAFPQADAKGLITWDVNVASTLCRAHGRAAGRFPAAPLHHKDRSMEAFSLPVAELEPLLVGIPGACLRGLPGARLGPEGK